MLVNSPNNMLSIMLSHMESNSFVNIGRITTPNASNTFFYEQYVTIIIPIIHIQFCISAKQFM